jgi:mitochondrial fission protein ELM1
MGDDAKKPGSDEGRGGLAEPAASGPRTWLVIGDKLGDNAQVRLIAEGLGWPVEERRLEFLPPYQKGRPRFVPSLFHLDRDRSDALEPPWPDLVLTVGRRPCMAALWIQEQSGGRARLVLLGRPKRWLERFSLVIAPSQYLVPSRPNVMHLEFPLLRLDEARVEGAAREWEPRLRDLARPIHALLVGGETKPFRFDAAAARDLIQRATDAASGGSLYVTTSRRTPDAVADTLAEGLPPGARFHRWSPDGADNPYLGLLGLADRFIVTGDSMSMLLEVARLGKPLAVYDFPVRKGPRTWVQSVGRHLADRGPVGSAIRDALFRAGFAVYSRDLTRVHRLLFDRGSAVPLGHPWPESGVPLQDELPAVIARVRRVAEGERDGIA